MSPVFYLPLLYFCTLGIILQDYQSTRFSKVLLILKFISFDNRWFAIVNLGCGFSRLKEIKVDKFKKVQELISFVKADVAKFMTLEMELHEPTFLKQCRALKFYRRKSDLRLPKETQQKIRLFIVLGINC